MADPIRICAYYMTDVVSSPEYVIERAQSKLSASSISFDTLVGTGLSGAVIVPRLAESLGVNWLLVRKRNDGSHSPQPCEGYLGRRWLFVDDLIDSGETLNRCRDIVARVAGLRRYATEHVGSYLYRDDLLEIAGNDID
jgi:adenine/guanine phosphoribosyltransferase-like PRPP-binding protein